MIITTSKTRANLKLLSFCKTTESTTSARYPTAINCQQELTAVVPVVIPLDSSRFRTYPSLRLDLRHRNEASVSRTLRGSRVQLGVRNGEGGSWAGYLERRFMTAAAESAPTAAPAPAARSHSFARSPISGRRCLKPLQRIGCSNKINVSAFRGCRRGPLRSDDCRW